MVVLLISFRFHSVQCHCKQGGLYRVGLVVWQLGWVDLDLGSSPCWWAATVATYCPSRMVEHSKSKSTQPTDKPPAPPCMALMMFVQMLFVIMERVCVKKKDLLLTLPV